MVLREPVPMIEAVLVGGIFGTAAILSALLTPLCRRLGHRFDVMDRPGVRKLHPVAVPRSGGPAVFVAFVAVVLAGYLAVTGEARPWIEEALGPAGRLLQDAHRVRTRLMGVLGGAAIAFAIGALDDIFGARFSVVLKAAGQVLAALILVAAGVRTTFLPFEWMNAVVTVLWVVGITNAFNFLDNMDGLSAGVAFVASAVLLGTAYSLGEFFISSILAAFMGSLLGFLFFNMRPASVFLGDSGSLFIGYTMSSLTLLERYVSHASSSLFPVFMPVLVLAVPLLDTATVVAIRLRERRPIYVGDRCHLSHRLVALGLSQRVAVAVLYLMTFCLGIGAASLTDATVGQAIRVLFQSAAFITIVLILLFFQGRGAGGTRPG